MQHLILNLENVEFQLATSQHTPINATELCYPTIAELIKNWQQFFDEDYKRKEETMENSNAENKRYLTNRIYDIKWKKQRVLESAFFISDEEEPKDTEEALDRIAKGRYEVEKKDEDFGCNGDSWFERLRWRNPANKPDKIGFKNAEDRMNKVYMQSVDTISILSPEEGLKAFREFEATDFTKN
jgi:hypothetical protein